MSDNFESDVISIDRANGVATLWLDAPDRRNAMGPAFWTDLPRAAEALSADDSVRAVVLAGRGRHFSVGLDLVEMAPALTGSGSSPAARARDLHRQIVAMQGSINALVDCPKPVIAAVHGACIGAGVDLVCACDLRVCSTDARFSVRETRLAIVADLGTLQRLPAIVGLGHVAELAYTGRDIDAGWAARIGLVNHVLDDADSAYKHARDIALEIAANSPLAVQGTKRILRGAHAAAVADGLDRVAVWNAAHLISNDLTEALAAFAEKRSPTYTGD